jgi:plasmid stabilization system protein ParE
MVEVRWTDQAIQDIDRIAEYIAQDSLKYAKLQTQHFFDEVRVLEQFPKSGRIVPEFKITSVRELISGNYRNCLQDLI